jgi:23S rRNA pseudouridine1911/1915/1917 synthase
MGTTLTEPDEVAEDVLESFEEPELRTIVFAAQQHGLRLDLALTQAVPELSRSYLKQLIVAGAARRGAEIVTKPAFVVHWGEAWTVELRPTAQSQAFKPEALQLSVVHEDADLLVIDKAVGMVVHPAPGHWSGTLLNALLARDARAAKLPRAGIVHRLDKDTSGLMVVARSRAAMDALTAMIGVRSLRREYLALAHRPWKGAPLRHIDQAIGRDPRNRLRMAVVDLARHPGKLAITDVALLAQAPAGCLLKCKLHTGRTHQIRVHLSHAGHPLLADALYGGPPAAGLSRQALHAWRLTFDHPVNHEPMAFHAAPPEDFLQALKSWGLGYNPAQWLDEPAP